MGGRLEHEIRLLPQVLSCSFSKDDYVVVLVDPSADLAATQFAVERILANAGSHATVRVIGPAERADVAATRVVSPLVATATVATVAAIGVGALVGGLAAAADHPVKPVRPATRPAGAAAVAPTDSIDLLRGIQISAAAPVTPVSVPAETADHAFRVFPVSHGTAVEAVSLTRAIPPVHGSSGTSAGEHSAESRRGSDRSHGAHRQGKGPRGHSDHHSGHHGKGMGRG